MATFIAWAVIFAAALAVKLLWICLTAPFRILRDIINMRRERRLRRRGYIIIREKPDYYCDEFDRWEEDQWF